MKQVRQAKRITVRLPASLQARLARRAKLAGKTESELVRESVEAHLAEEPKRESALDLARKLGLVGIAKALPSDLSTNPKYMRGFGTGK